MSYVIAGLLGVYLGVSAVVFAIRLAIFMIRDDGDLSLAYEAIQSLLWFVTPLRYLVRALLP